MNQIVFITGGTRSGKSRYAQSLAENLSAKPVYLATARRWDDDFVKRIERHQADRGDNWRTVEETRRLSNHDFTGEVILMDCVTLWLTNIFYENNYDLEQSLTEAKAEWDKFIGGNFTLIVVSNELGMCIHPADEVSRKFTDLQGWVNQHIARSATQVFTIISGIPLQLK